MTWNPYATVENLSSRLVEEASRQKLKRSALVSGQDCHDQ